MSNEELLKPRYQATGPDAYCMYGRGDILSYRTYHDIEVKWWQARKISDLPQYLLAPGWTVMSTVAEGDCEMIRHVTKRTELILKVREYLTTGIIAENGGFYDFEMHNLMPSTQKDYESPKEIPKPTKEEWEKECQQQKEFWNETVADGKSREDLPNSN